MSNRKLWVYRDRLGWLYATTQKPVKTEDNLGWTTHGKWATLILDSNKMKYLTYDSSPQLVDFPLE